MARTQSSSSSASLASGVEVRPARHAGSWYSGDPKELRHDLDTDLSTGKPVADGKTVLALIGPHAGLRFSGAVAGAGYEQLAKQNVRRVFLFGPSHHIGFDGVALPPQNMTGWETPLGNLQIDPEAVQALRDKPGFSGPSQAHFPEHSLEMHAIFIAALKPKALLVPLVVGQLGGPEEIEQLAAAIRPLLKDGDVVVASSDFTHYGASYGYVPFKDHVRKNIEGYANEAADALTKLDSSAFVDHLKKTEDTICGRDPIRILLALLPKDATGTRVAFDTSGRMTNDDSMSVTYQSIVYTRAAGWGAFASAKKPDADPGAPTLILDKKGEAKALEMARKTLEMYLRDRKIPSADELGVPADGAFKQTLSVFVTLKRDGNLRGCIGHIEAIEPLWQDIRDNAIAAAVHDPRFSPVTADALELLDLEISVLTPLKQVAGPEGFVVGRHGVVLSVFGRHAVFLPQVAPEQGWDRETTLAHLAMKAGLQADAWRDQSARFEVFEAEVFGEKEEHHN